MVTAQPGFAPRLEELVFDTEPGQPITEIADGLVVVEMGLADPPFGPRAADDEPTLAVGARR